MQESMNSNLDNVFLIVKDKIPLTYHRVGIGFQDVLAIGVFYH